MVDLGTLTSTPAEQLDLQCTLLLLPKAQYLTGGAILGLDQIHNLARVCSNFSTSANASWQLP